MNYTMKNISLFTCSVMASIVVLSACAQTTVSVRPTPSINESQTKKANPPRKQYEPISLNEPYVVQAGDTLYGISFRAGVSYRDLATWNNISEPYTVKIGQRILLRSSNNNQNSDATATVVSNTIVTNPVRPVEIKPAEAKPVVVIKAPVVVATQAVETAAVPVAPITSPVAPTSNAITAPATETKPATNATIMSWRWPSEGTLIARYVQGDTAQQGINIGGKSGQAIHASADGTVVYSGAGLVGYGELIIIKHNNEWLSAYAHSRRRLVAEGTKVKSGDVIAEMGRTGTMRDMLHFEIRRNGKPVDPLLYLPKQ